MTDQKLILLTLPIQSVELIVAALKELPAKHVFDILSSILTQTNEQIIAKDKVLSNEDNV